MACNCSDIPSDCIPQPLLPACADPEYCEEVIADKCIVHKGATLANLTAPDGTRLDVIFTHLEAVLTTYNSQIASLQARVTALESH